jgi:hypothetical protein
MGAALVEYCTASIPCSRSTTTTVTQGCAVVYGERRIVLDFYLLSRMICAMHSVYRNL